MVQSDAWCIHKPVHPFHDVQCIDSLGVPSKMQDVVLGVMLIIVMGIALNNKRISGFFERKARRKELMKRA